jgi:hypothetical protein
LHIQRVGAVREPPLRVIQIPHVALDFQRLAPFEMHVHQIGKHAYFIIGIRRRYFYIQPVAASNRLLTLVVSQ